MCIDIYTCTINSKINGTPKGAYLPILKPHLLQLKSNVASKWASKHLWGTIYCAIDGLYTHTYIYIYIYILYISIVGIYKHHKGGLLTFMMRAMGFVFQ